MEYIDKVTPTTTYHQMGVKGQYRTTISQECHNKVGTVNRTMVGM